MTTKELPREGKSNPLSTLKSNPTGCGLASPPVVKLAPMNSKTLFEAIGSAKSVKLGLASNPESSSAWVKTLIDPAHAREYGCRGIPDENQQPTLVLNGRDTTTITPLSVVNTAVECFGYTPVSSTAAASWDPISLVSSDDKVFTDVYIMQTHVSSPFLILYYGRIVSTSRLYVEVYRMDPLVSASTEKLCRVVAQSATVSWVAKEIDKAGFFEAGYLIPGVYEGNSGSIEYRYNLDDAKNLVTYTADARDGVYIVSTFNDFDLYRYWKGVRNVLGRIRLNGATMNIKSYPEFSTPQTLGGMRPYFVHYAVYSSNGAISGIDNTWALRITTNQAVEQMTPYNAGGSDAAVYDRMSVEDMIALYDSFDLIFPSSYNDWKMVWNWIKGAAPKAAQLASSVLRHFPHTAGVGSALGALVGDVKSEQPAISALQSAQAKAVNEVKKLGSAPKKRRRRGKKKSGAVVKNGSN